MLRVGEQQDSNGRATRTWNLNGWTQARHPYATPKPDRIKAGREGLRSGKGCKAQTGTQYANSQGTLPLNKSDRTRTDALTGQHRRGKRGKSDTDDKLLGESLTI